MEYDPDNILSALPDNVIEGRIPLWDLTNLVHRSCPVCGCGKQSSYSYRPDRLKVVRCNECDMLYVSDIPTSNQIKNFYLKYSTFKKYSSSRFSFIRRYLDGLRHPYITIMRNTGGLEGMELLDVGCAYGEILQVARQQGANVHGLEIDEKAVSHLKTYGIPVYSEFPNSIQFDIICAFQLLEHLEDPNEFLEKVCSNLKKDG